MLRNGTLLTTSQQRPDSFSADWRVPDESSLYTGTCGTDESTVVTSPTYCSCHSTGVSDCNPQGDVVMCPFMTLGETDITDTLLEESVYPAKCGSQSGFSYPEFEYDVYYNPPDIDVTKPTQSGMAPSFIRSLCSYFLDSNAISSQCKHVIGVDVENSLLSCFLDLMITSDFAWQKSAIDNVITQCELQIARNVSTWVVNPNSTFVGPDGNFTDQFCIAECGGAGSCVRGDCQCREFFAGADCFVATDQPPNLFFLANDGLCDSSRDVCDTVTIYNNNTINITTLACYFMPAMTNATGTYPISQTETRTASTFRSVNELKCPLPSTSGGSYYVKITNDNVFYSSTATLIIYDSRCFNCTASTSACVRKTSSCLIDGKCFDDGDFSPDNSRNFCSANVNASSWQQANNSCETLDLVWVKQQGMAMGASSTSETYITDENNCRQLCLSQYNSSFVCSAFSYNTTSKTCTMSTEDKIQSPGRFFPQNGTNYYEWQCQNNPCGKRGLSWSRLPGFAILGNGDRVVTARTRAACRDACLRELSFLCRSFSFLVDAQRCSLFAVTRAQAGPSFVRFPGYIFEEWRCAAGADLPILTSSPMAQIERDPTGGEKDFTLVCSWNAIETNSSLRYNVEWFIDDTIVQEVHLNNSFNRAYMSRSLLKALPLRHAAVLWSKRMRGEHMQRHFRTTSTK
ncbi:uncharacterized protein LOC112565065 [Pomacea canaliculata]|uniref:uncharacterized protein LOC112565065 n=1 Tax=Pomacea canaliculata TaxID=400727 RepID=UPI000D731A41|nr:uncharacterized protein LOC112565065 [Pomacea canaliculata]